MNWIFVCEAVLVGLMLAVALSYLGEYLDAEWPHRRRTLLLLPAVMAFVTPLWIVYRGDLIYQIFNYR